MSRQDQKETGLVNAAGVPYAEIIRSRRRERNMNQEELGVLAHVGKNAVGAWESGRSRPDLNSVPIICEALGLSLDEFYGIRGNEKKEEKIPEEFASRYAALTPYHRKIVLHEMDALLEMQRAAAKPKRKMIRLFCNDLSACAGPSLAIGETEGEEVWMEETPLTARADELIRVSGDSMEPVLRDGQYAWVEECARLNPGEVGLFTVDGEGFIKVYDEREPEEDEAENFTDSEGVRHLQPVLVSFNEAYAPKAIASGTDFRIIGDPFFQFE